MAKREPPPVGAEDVCTVEFAAGWLQLHPKTVLRFIRDGRLAAKRIGKSYRIRRADLGGFAGAPQRALEARVSGVVDLGPVGPEQARWWMQAVPAALQGRDFAESAMRADVIYDREAGRLKILLVGSPGDTAALLGLIKIWLGQPPPDRGRG